MRKYVLAAAFYLFGLAGAYAAAPCTPFTGYPLVLNFGIGPNTGTGEDLNCTMQKVQKAVNAFSQGFIGTIARNQTEPVNYSDAVMIAQNTSRTAQSIYGPVTPPGWFTVDGIRSTVVALNGSRAVNTNAFGYYLSNQQAEGGLGQNAVGVYGVTTCEVNNCASWGLNPALIDSAQNGTITNGTGRKLIGMEIDLSATSPNTLIQGVSLLGSSLVQPAGADGFSCGSLGGPALWTHCFVVPDGVAKSGLYLGSVGGAAGPIKPSNPVQFAYYRADGTGRILNLLATNDLMAIQPAAGGNGFAFQTQPSGTAPFIAPLSDEPNMGLELRGQGTGSVVTRSQLIADSGLGVNGLTTIGRAPRASLPLGIPAGGMYYCTNCLKPGQSAGAGTGMLVFWDGVSWYSSAGTLAAN